MGYRDSRADQVTSDQHPTPDIPPHGVRAKKAPALGGAAGACLFQGCRRCLNSASHISVASQTLANDHVRARDLMKSRCIDWRNASENVDWVRSYHLGGVGDASRTGSTLFSDLRWTPGRTLHFLTRGAKPNNPIARSSSCRLTSLPGGHALAAIVNGGRVKPSGLGPAFHPCVAPDRLMQTHSARSLTRLGLFFVQEGASGLGLQSAPKARCAKNRF